LIYRLKKIFGIELPARYRERWFCTGLVISAARFTGFLLRRQLRTQHSSAGLFSNVRFADFNCGFPKVVVALGLIGLFVITIPAQTPSSQDVDVIRTETDLTNLLFTATDKNNRYLTTLQQSDIRVLEDGVPQTLFTFQRETDRPLSVAFLIASRRSARFPMKKLLLAPSSKTSSDRIKTRRRLFLSKATRISNNH